MKTSQFQFINPYLVEVDFKINPNFNLENGEIEMQNEFSIQVKRSQNENRANVQLTLDSNKENSDTPFEIHIVVASDFKWEDMEENRVENMLKINAPAFLLSYMRPIVANITNATNFPAYNLPFVNFKVQ